MATPSRARWRLSLWDWPAVGTVAVIAGALFPAPPLRDPMTLLPASDVTLSAPAAYLVLAPICNVLDALALLGTRQHHAVVCTVLVVALLWCTVRHRGSPAGGQARALAITAAVLLVAALGGYAGAVLIARPMVALHVTDPDLVAVDFHSHTNFSWDGRRSFTVERNRDWHRAGGWNVAYITDHLTVEGADLGFAANPARAGDDTIILPAIESRGDGTHLVVLGITEDDRVQLHGQQTQGRLPYDERHAVIQTIPATLAKVRARRRSRVGILVAIEVSDGSPHGLDQEQRERPALREIAEQRDLAVVSASNTHGWTSTPVAWSLLRIPGWRDLSPGALDLRIQELLHREGSRAVRVVERYGTDAGATIVGLGGSAPSALWRLLTTLSPAERLSWLLWGWGVAVASRCVRRSKSSSNVHGSGIAPMRARM